jgi:CRISPR-associated protein Csb1
MTELKALDLETLERAVAGESVAIRRVTRLQPAGGKGDKIFPPTYMKEGRAETKYAMERRKVPGREQAMLCVLLDSVASQANRMEEALLEAHRRGELKFPIVGVDFSKEEQLDDLEQITTLQAPHRIADALLRDSLHEGVPFRQSAIGRAVTDARPNSATAMFKYCPTALVFGVWDSTGPKGGLGSKFQRALVSEVVGIDIETGVKTASRLDPAGIEKQAGPVFAKKGSDDWTADPNDAEKDKKSGQPIPFSRGGEGKPGQPSKINHGNIPPTIDSEAGGVTMDHALHTAVLSLPALRRLRFRENLAGEVIPAIQRDAAEGAARTLLAALALAAIAYQEAAGYDLRSRSLLVPESGGEVEVIARAGGEPTKYVLPPDAARVLLEGALEKAARFGMRWSSDFIALRPTPKLAQLIRVSRQQVQAGEIQTDA